MEERTKELEQEIASLKEMQENLKVQNEEARSYRKEYLKEVNIIVFPLKKM